MRRWVPWLSAVPLLLATTAAAVELRPVLSGLVEPLYVTHARDGSDRLFVVERAGVVQVLQPGASAPTVFLDIRDRVLAAGGEQGLLGLTFHPQYPANGRFFVSYTRPPDGAIVIAEYRRAADPQVAQRDEFVVLTVAKPFANHNGGMIEFGPDGFLYIATGDGGSGNDPGNRGQSLNTLLGKILRIDVSRLPETFPPDSRRYLIPSTNPFGPGGGLTPGADEIYAFGLRNPFRFSFDRANEGLIHVGDVGQNSFEEISRVTRGANLGWRVFEGFHCTGLDPALCPGPPPPGSGFFHTPPIAEYGHTGGRCSVTGGYVYRGTRGTFPPGTYVFADFCSGEIFALGGSSPPLSVIVLLDTDFLISSFGEDEEGEIYVVDFGGTVHRLIGLLEPARDAFITGFYTHVLGRAADAQGLALWTDFLRANCNAGGIQAPARGFFGSGEFAALRALSLQELVAVLYRSLLGREPDASGLAGWANVLRQGRLEVALSGFLPSAEFRALSPDRTSRPAVEAVIMRFYTQILGRPPDAAGFAGWVNFVLATGDLETAAVGFLASAEFEARALSLQGHVTILYRAFLDREPDPAGLAAWQSVLQAGVLNVVETGFLPSAEFDLAELCG